MCGSDVIAKYAITAPKLPSQYHHYIADAVRYNRTGVILGIDNMVIRDDVELSYAMSYTAGAYGNVHTIELLLYAVIPDADHCAVIKRSIVSHGRLDVYKHLQLDIETKYLDEWAQAAGESGDLNMIAHIKKQYQDQVIGDEHYYYEDVLKGALIRGRVDAIILCVSVMTLNSAIHVAVRHTTTKQFIQFVSALDLSDEELASCMCVTHGIKVNLLNYVNSRLQRIGKYTTYNGCLHDIILS